mmetsp:Transcript_173284/g.555774  ORF Transcript_173284/g.555774 Transcript_173284/m.555774 type:complete len:300 (-) Transcript_173284:114-1013(-)
MVSAFSRTKPSALSTFRSHICKWPVNGLSQTRPTRKINPRLALPAASTQRCAEPPRYFANNHARKNFASQRATNVSPTTNHGEVVPAATPTRRGRCSGRSMSAAAAATEEVAVRAEAAAAAEEGARGGPAESLCGGASMARSHASAVACTRSSEAPGLPSCESTEFPGDRGLLWPGTTVLTTASSSRSDSYGSRTPGSGTTVPSSSSSREASGAELGGPSSKCRWMREALPSNAAACLHCAPDRAASLQGSLPKLWQSAANGKSRSGRNNNAGRRNATTMRKKDGRAVCATAKRLGEQR